MSREGISDYRGRSSKNISDLKKRLPKCWAWVDQVLSKTYPKELIKKEVVLTLLSKAIPSKIEGEGFDSGKQFVVVYPQGMKKENLNGNGIRETLLPQDISS